MAQTPQQRKANEKFAKHEASKRGKAKTTTVKHSPKPSLSTGWVVLLAFVVCGGLIFELLRVVPELCLCENTPATHAFIPGKPHTTALFRNTPGASSVRFRWDLDVPKRVDLLKPPGPAEYESGINGNQSSVYICRP